MHSPYVSLRTPPRPDDMYAVGTVLVAALVVWMFDHGIVPWWFATIAVAVSAAAVSHAQAVHSCRRYVAEAEHVANAEISAANAARVRVHQAERGDAARESALRSELADLIFGAVDDRSVVDRARRKAIAGGESGSQSATTSAEGDSVE